MARGTPQPPSPNPPYPEMRAGWFAPNGSLSGGVLAERVLGPRSRSWSRINRWFPGRAVDLVGVVVLATVRRRRRSRPLHAAALAARAEALEHLWADAEAFASAIERYVNAVEVADEARRAWERLERPLSSKGSYGQLVEHPLVRTMERLDRAAAAFGAALGLDPVSAARLGRVGVFGRPPGANSADDRKADLTRRGEPPFVTLRAVPSPPRKGA
jgi:hypothetical protein